MSNKTKIYITFDLSGNTSRVIGLALAADGKCIRRVVAPSLMRGRHDMGLTSEEGHDVYNKRYPKGWELEFVPDPKRHDGYAQALIEYANQQLQFPREAKS